MTTQAIIEFIIDGLHRDAAMNIALAERSPQHRRHDARIYKERAQAALQAVAHLEGELA